MILLEEPVRGGCFATILHNFSASPWYSFDPHRQFHTLHRSDHASQAVKGGLVQGQSGPLKFSNIPSGSLW